MCVNDSEQLVDNNTLWDDRVDRVTEITMNIDRDNNDRNNNDRDVLSVSEYLLTWMMENNTLDRRM